MAEPKHYYYARGRREPLELDEDRVALDLEQAERLEGSAAQVARELAAEGKELRRGVYLIERSRIPEEERGRLAAANLLHPVFHHGSTTLVALPEVRIEAGGKGKEDELRRFLRGADSGAEVVEDRGYRMTVRPKSGSGMDALNLANRLGEKLGAQLAQVRFLRMTPRPTTGKKK